MCHPIHSGLEAKELFVTLAGAARYLDGLDLTADASDAKALLQTLADFCRLRRPPITIVCVRGMRPADVIYAGRNGPHLFANFAHPLAEPLKLAKLGKTYEAWLDEHPRRDQLLDDLAREVDATGKPLGCWCPVGSLGCHARVLADRVAMRLALPEFDSLDLLAERLDRLAGSIDDRGLAVAVDLAARLVENAADEVKATLVA